MLLIESGYKQVLCMCLTANNYALSNQEFMVLINSFKLREGE